MTTAATKGKPSPSARLIVPALGVTQILAWGSSYYLLAVLAQPIADDTGWPLTWVIGGFSVGLLVAGLVSPFVGRQIDRYGGKPVLIAGTVLFATGSLALALAPTLLAFIAAWTLMGFGMSAGLYNAAFSVLGRMYGQGARRHITTITLFGGFASTVCWPLSAFFLHELGWRGTCVAYAAIHLLFSLTVYIFALPREHQDGSETAAPVGEAPAESERAYARPSFIFALLASTITIGSMLSTIVSVHLLTILQSREMTLSAAVALSAIVGPSQVGARFIEVLIGKHHHPVWTLIASVVSVAVGLGLLWGHFPVVALALVLYGAGIGLSSIARATLPLVLFGARNYAQIMGKLARPILIAQAIAPSIGAFLIEWLGLDQALETFAAAALLNIVLVVALYFAQRQVIPSSRD